MNLLSLNIAALLILLLPCCSCNEGWKEKVEDIVHLVQDSYRHADNNEKAQTIKNFLPTWSSLFNNMTFYVIVYNAGDGIHHHHMRGRNYVTSFQRGGCNVVVAGSATAYKREKNPPSDMLRDTLSQMKQNGFDFAPDKDIHVREVYSLINPGFVAVIGDHNIGLAWSGDRQWGPGSWERVKVHGNRGWIIATYP